MQGEVPTTQGVTLVRPIYVRQMISQSSLFFAASRKQHTDRQKL